MKVIQNSKCKIQKLMLLYQTMKSKRGVKFLSMLLCQNPIPLVNFKIINFEL